MQTLILSVVGTDRPGLVEALSKVVADHHGNWLESKMAIMGGKFAGIVEISIPEDQIDSLNEALAGLKSQGLSARSEAGSADTGTEYRPLTLELLGQDRPGIIRDISAALTKCGVSVDELETEIESASMAGGELFRSRAELRVPLDTDIEELRATLEQLANELMVDIEFEGE